MNRNTALPLNVLTVVFLTTAFSASAQKAYLHLNNRSSNTKTFSTENSNALADIKNIFIADNAKIVKEDSASFTVEMPNTKWAWEAKDGSPDNETAIVVINKLYDIGANKIKKPKSVTTIWVVSIAADKKSYTITLQDVLSIYASKTKFKTGYTTWLLEDRIVELVK